MRSGEAAGGGSDPTDELFGLAGKPAVEVIARIREGFPFTFVDAFHDRTAMPLQSIAEFMQVTPATLESRRRTGRLTPEESERLLRLATLVRMAVTLFEGDAGAAMHWLETPHRALSDHKPLAMGQTELGAREVEKLIGRLEHGVFT